MDISKLIMFKIEESLKPFILKQYRQNIKAIKQSLRMQVIALSFDWEAHHEFPLCNSYITSMTSDLLVSKFLDNAPNVVPCPKPQLVCTINQNPMTKPSQVAPPCGGHPLTRLIDSIKESSYLVTNEKSTLLVAVYTINLIMNH